MWRALTSTIPCAWLDPSDAAGLYHWWDIQGFIFPPFGIILSILHQTKYLAGFINT
jgi:hypothetical protein